MAALDEGPEGREAGNDDAEVDLESAEEAGVDARVGEVRRGGGGNEADADDVDGADAFGGC